ncbi:uridine kinase family protein [Actinoplanes sp. CA-030573]|uniref:uridine kinase family protein n=1 Tax=Actinoplanes sp. CA-030573 TaxID=3239898 RepID=UPI003D948E27
MTDADGDGGATVEPNGDIELGPGEPAAGPWRVQPLPVFARSVVRAAEASDGRLGGNPGGRLWGNVDGRPDNDSGGQPRDVAGGQPRDVAGGRPRDVAGGRPRGDAGGRPRVIAVDGRGGGGKTTLAGRLARALGAAAVVHSDDVAWAHSRFGWDDLMIDGILEPLRAGGAVRYRPPGWERDGRDGHIEVPAGLATVIVEGVGVSRETLAPYLDVAIWVQSDYAEAKRRGVRRDMAEEGRDAEEADRNWEEWEAEEVPFLLGDRPWRRARFIVGTASALAHDPATEVVVSDGPAGHVADVAPRRETD